MQHILFSPSLDNMARTIKPQKPKGKGPIKSGKKIIDQKVARKKTLSIKTPTVKQLPVKKSTTRIRRHIEKEIKYYQGALTHLVPKATFIRMLKSMISQTGSELKITKHAISALQDAYESFIVATMETSYLATNHAKRVTLKQIDIAVAKRIRERGLF